MEKIGIDWKIFLGQIINFVILLYLLKRFVYNPFLSLLEERRRKIKEGIENSQRAEEKMEEIKKLREEILENAQKRAIQIVEKAEERGKEKLEEIILEGEKERERRIKEAIKEANEKKKEAQKEIKREAIGIGLALAEEILKEKLTVEKDKNLIERFLMRFQKQYDKSS